MLMYRANGRPRSRANDHVMREAAARQPIALQNSSTITMLVIMVAPAFEPTAYSKIRMNGEREDGSTNRSTMFGALNRTANSMPKARQPLITRLSIIDLATSLLAFLTSSDICSD